MSYKSKKSAARKQRERPLTADQSDPISLPSKLKGFKIGAFIGTLPLLCVGYYQISEERLLDFRSGLCWALGAVHLTPHFCSSGDIVREAQEAFKRKEKDKTLKLLDQALVLGPDNPTAIDLRGQIEMDAGHDENAEADFSRAIDTASLPDAYLHRAELNFKQKRVLAALADIDEALRRNPRSAQYHVEKAFFLNARDGHFTEAAQQELDKATEIEPDDTKVALASGMAKLGDDPRRGAELATAVIEKNPTFSKAYVLRALYEMRQGQETAAEKDCNAAISLDGKNVDAINGLGWVLINKGQDQAAIASFSKAIELEPSYGVPLENRSTAYVRIGRYDDALADITRAISLTPTAPELYYNRAIIYAARKKAGDLDQAAADFSRSLDRDPKFAASYLGRAELAIDRGDHQAAIEDADKAIASSKEWRAFALRGIARDHLGMFREALADFDAAEASGGRDGMISEGRGRAFLGLGQTDKAIHIFEELKTEYGQSATLDQLIGAAYFASEKYDAALQAFLRADESGSDGDGAIARNIGMTYLRQSDADLAIHWLDEAIARSPRDDQAYEAKGIALSIKGEWAAASEAFTSAARLSPHNADYLSRKASALDHAGHKAEAVESLNAAVSLRPNDNVLRRSRALMYVNNSNLPGDFAAAQKKVDLLSDDDPEKPKFQCFLAAKKDDARVGAGPCHAAVQKFPDDADVRFALCAISMDAGDLHQADRECHAVTRLDPQHARAFAILALVAASGGDNDLAIEEAGHARTLAPTLDLAWFALAVAYQGQQDWQRAADASHEATRFNSKAVIAYILQADSLRRLDRFDEAAGAVRSALALDPANPLLADIQGIMHLQKGEPAAAVKDFSEATRLENTSGIFFAHRAIAYLQLHDDRDAVLDLSRAIEVGFTEGDIYNLRGAAEERLGMKDAAADDCYRATHQLVPRYQAVPQIADSEFPLQGLDPKNIQVSLGSPAR